MTSTSSPALQEFHWTPQPEAAGLVESALQEFRRVPWIIRLERRLREETGTRLVDWIDHLSLPDTDGISGRLSAAGFTALETNEGSIWRHPAGLFPTILLHAGQTRRLILKVESVPDLIMAHGLTGNAVIEGDPLADLRRARVAAEGDCECWVIERHGSRAFEPSLMDAPECQAVVFHREAFLLRQRDWHAAAAGFEHARTLIAAAVTELGTPRACDLFFAAERAFWQSRNRAGQIQKARQDRLGLGWANHDHHTYRSSRECFAELIAVLELLGFACRERFYAGRTAGWGAQVLEQPDCGIVIFADVDLSPEEVAGDFAHEPLPPRDTLGTVGLWCRLHGEAFLQAGMHHLECQFDFDAAREQLKAAGVETMKPFTDMPHLRQAFTKGEIWPVDPRRIEAVLAEGQISAEDAERFRTAGALGSHLEILQRDEGYKGFNQSGIDEIILKTDPRQAAAAAQA
jgi:hypothetical protein